MESVEEDGYTGRDQSPAHLTNDDSSVLKRQWWGDRDRDRDRDQSPAHLTNDDSSVLKRQWWADRDRDRDRDLSPAHLTTDDSSVLKRQWWGDRDRDRDLSPAHLTNDDSSDSGGETDRDQSHAHLTNDDGRVAVHRQDEVLEVAVGAVGGGPAAVTAAEEGGEENAVDVEAASLPDGYVADLAHLTAAKEHLSNIVQCSEVQYLSNTAGSGRVGMFATYTCPKQCVWQSRNAPSSTTPVQNSVYGRVEIPVIYNTCPKQCV